MSKVKDAKRLSTAQLGFIRDIVAGMSKVDAYRKNYPNNMSKKTINKRASELFRQPHIQEKYNELLENIKLEEALVKTVVYEKENAIKDLIYLKEKARQSIENDGFRQASSNSFLNAIKELCVLNDLYPKKNKDELGVTENQVADDLLSIMEQVKSSMLEVSKDDIEGDTDE